MRERRRPGWGAALGACLVLLPLAACDDARHAPVTPPPSTGETDLEDRAADVAAPGPVETVPGPPAVPAAPPPDPAAVTGLTEVLDEAEALIDEVERELAEDE